METIKQIQLEGENLGANSTIKVVKERVSPVEERVSIRQLRDEIQSLKDDKVRIDILIQSKRDLIDKIKVDLSINE